MSVFGYRQEDFPDIARMPSPRPDNFSYVIPVDYLLHSQEKPFCYDETCDCHEDEILIAEVNIFVQDGLMTPDEATDFVRGKGI